MTKLAQGMCPDSMCSFLAQLRAGDTQPTWLAGVAAILFLWISLSVGATEVAIAILGALTYAIFFNKLPVQAPRVKGKTISVNGEHGKRAAKPYTADSLPPAPGIQPPPGLKSMQPSSEIVETPASPQTPDLTEPPCGLQRSRQGDPKGLEWGLHLRDTMLALSRPPTKPWETDSFSNSNLQRSSSTNRRSHFIPSKRLEQVASDENSLRANLQKLAMIEPDRVVMVKKIGKLGFKSDLVIKAHFRKFGTVEQVLISHAVDKNVPGHEGSRVRPGNTGFVIMSNAEEVSAALAHGSDQAIEGVSIVVAKYVSRHAEHGSAT